MSGSNPTTPAHDDWIRRVLGIDVGAAAPGNAGDRGLAAWTTACDDLETASNDASAQIGALRSALAGFDEDEEIQALARSTEFSLNGVTGGKRVPLMAALLEVRGKDLAAMKAGLPKVINAAQALQAHLDSDPQVDACDDNPFGVAVAIRSTVGPALTRLQAASAALLR